MGIFDKVFRPRQDKFLALLQEQAQSTLAGLELAGRVHALRQQ